MSREHIEVNGHELTAFDLPPEPSNTYHVCVDDLGEIVVERGKPPKEKDVPAMYMRKLVPELCEQNAELHRENARLRELVRGLHVAYIGALNECEGMDEGLIWEYSGSIDADVAKSKARFEADRHRFDVAMGELGIEVEDA